GKNVCDNSRRWNHDESGNFELRICCFSSPCSRYESN
ncbi:hypothetical protein AVDCRST_MAG84-4927, partial [uncultured Microcoleus sp.]